MCEMKMLGIRKSNEFDSQIIYIFILFVVRDSGEAILFVARYAFRYPLPLVLRNVYEEINDYLGRKTDQKGLSVRS